MHLTACSPLSACPLCTETKWSQWIHGEWFVPQPCRWIFFFCPLLLTSCSNLFLLTAWPHRTCTFSSAVATPFSICTLRIRILWLRHLSHQEPQDYRLLQQSHNAPTKIRDLVKADLTLNGETVAASYFSGTKTKTNVTVGMQPYTVTSVDSALANIELLIVWKGRPLGNLAAMDAELQKIAAQLQDHSAWACVAPHLIPTVCQ